MKKYTFTVLAIILTTLSFCQQSTLGINIKVYDPISQFKENINKAVPAGISINYLRSRENSRYSFGGEAGVAMYSSTDYELNYRGQNVDVNEEDCFWTFHGVARYDLVRTEKFISYVEARAGLTTFFSSTVAIHPDSSYPGEFSFHGSAFNTGLGGGLLFRVAERAWINAGANLHSGSKVNYRYIAESNSSMTLTDGKYNSLTHYMGYRLGVSFSLL